MNQPILNQDILYAIGVGMILAILLLLASTVVLWNQRNGARAAADFLDDALQKAEGDLSKFRSTCAQLGISKNEQTVALAVVHKFLEKHAAWLHGRKYGLGDYWHYLNVTQLVRANLGLNPNNGGKKGTKDSADFTVGGYVPPAPKGESNPVVPRAA